MYINLLGNNVSQIFNIWVYDDKGLVRGSGLFVNKSGISANHHFLLPKPKTEFKFVSGDYNLQIFVETIGKKPIKIYEQKLNLTEEQAKEINLNGAGVYFDWTPDTQTYDSHVDYRPKTEEKFEDYLKLLTKEKIKK